MTTLGDAFATPSRGNGGGFEAMVADIITQVLAQTGKQLPPVVHVAQPSIKVEPAQVDVTHQITVQERENEPIVTLNVDFAELQQNLARNTEVLKLIHTDIQTLIALFQKPVTKAVHRGNGGLIDTVTETR